MSLSAFLQALPDSDAALGRKVGALLAPPRVIPRVTIRQWRIGRSVPRDPEIIKALISLGAGALTAAMIFGIDERSAIGGAN